MIQIKLSSKFEWFLAILIAVLIKFIILIQISGKYDFKSPDSQDYLLLSKNLTESYLGGKNSYSDISLLRTPGYPFFINIFSTSVFKVILAQIFISIAISIVLVLIVKKLSGSNSKKISFVVFIISQLETSLFVYSYKVLTEMLFAFLITLFIYLILLLKNIRNIFYAPSIFVILVFLMLVRPIGIIFVIVFAVLIIITSNRSFYTMLFLISLLIIGTYSFHNYSRSGIFAMSTVQNENLLMYEGVGAKSISERSTLSITQSEESILRNYKLGENPTVYAIDKYNFNRGLELILENKISFIKLHLVGVAKILFGPNKFELNELFSALSPTFESRFLKYLVVVFSLLTTFFISFLGFVSAGYFLKNKETRFLSVFLFIYLIFTSGANAYGRFRVPIAPILIIFTFLFINEIYKKRSAMKLNHRYK
jgi:hypothetical protein